MAPPPRVFLSRIRGSSHFFEKMADEKDKIDKNVFKPQKINSAVVWYCNIGGK